MRPRRWAMPDPYVLIVDDDPDARNLLTAIMASVGIRTKVANNGLDALALITADMPMLVLLDLMLPVMNGFEVMCHLRGDAQLRLVPVIIFSAWSFEEILMLPCVKKLFWKHQLRVSDLQTAVMELLGEKNPMISEKYAATCALEYRE
jgi:CheY-like chemotaxis protein